MSEYLEKGTWKRTKKKRKRDAHTDGDDGLSDENGNEVVVVAGPLQLTPPNPSLLLRLLFLLLPLVSVAMARIAMLLELMPMLDLFPASAVVVAVVAAVAAVIVAERPRALSILELSFPAPAACASTLRACAAWGGAPAAAGVSPLYQLFRWRATLRKG